MSTDSRQLRATAFHEAGHAVAHFALGRRIDRVSIISEDDTLGRVRGPVLPRSWDPSTSTGFDTLRELKAMEDAIVAALAGPNAEAKFRGRRNLLGARGDYETVGWLLQQTCDGSDHVSRAYYAYVKALAHDLIETHWYLVEALALELLDRRSLNGARVHQVLRREIKAHSPLLQRESSLRPTAAGWRQFARTPARRAGSRRA